MKIDIWTRINNHLNQFCYQFEPAIAWATNLDSSNTQELFSGELWHDYGKFLPNPQWLNSSINFLLTKQSQLQSFLSWSCSNCEQDSDNDGNSDFDLMIDAILAPEPVDQPVPVEPVGSVGDDD